VGLAFAAAAVPLLAPTPAGAVKIVKKEIAGEKFSLNLFGFSQFTLESGDGVAKSKDGTDDGLRVGADRVRIGYKIWWGKVFSKLHLDFNRPDISKSKAGLPELIKDAQVGYKFDKAAFFTIGMFKTPVGMDFNIPGKRCTAADSTHLNSRISLPVRFCPLQPPIRRQEGHQGRHAPC